RTAKCSIALGLTAGAVAALAHLTKGAVLPFVALYLLVYACAEAIRLLRRRSTLGMSAWRSAAALVFVITFLGVLYPYISTSKRVFGEYFYNVNSAFYVWYNNW